MRERRSVWWASGWSVGSSLWTSPPSKDRNCVLDINTEVQIPVDRE